MTIKKEQSALEILKSCTTKIDIEKSEKRGKEWVKVKVPTMVIDALKLVSNPFVKKQWLKQADSNLKYDSESLSFASQISGNDKLKVCSPLSIYESFLSAAASGLSFLNSESQVDLIPRDNVCRAEISALGRASKMITSGQIYRYDNPVAVYSCDEFSPDKDTNTINHKDVYPKGGALIIAFYIKIFVTKNDFYYVIVDADFIANLKTYKKVYVGGQLVPGKPMKKTDPNFLSYGCSKTIKQAFGKIATDNSGEGFTIETEPDYEADILEEMKGEHLTENEERKEEINKLPEENVNVIKGTPPNTGHPLRSAGASLTLPEPVKQTVFDDGLDDI